MGYIGFIMMFALVTFSSAMMIGWGYLYYHARQAERGLMHK